MSSNPRTPSRKSISASWNTYKQSIGDRTNLFHELVKTWPVNSALYVGSYLDLSPSTGIPSVTYVDTDRRAARFFADPELVAAELESFTLPGAAAEIRFLHADFTAPLELPDATFDLLIALYTGPAWDHCVRYLKPGGFFLANSSHGDASLAALDPRATLVGAIHHRDGRYRIDRDNLTSYLVPKKPENADADMIRSSGRGVAYTKPAFAYLFQLHG